MVEPPLVPPDPPDIRGYVARALRGGFPEARLFHLRDANGRHEVDILVELGDGRIIGIEVKAVAVCVRRAPGTVSAAVSWAA